MQEEHKWSFMRVKPKARNHVLYPRVEDFAPEAAGGSGWLRATMVEGSSFEQSRATEATDGGLIAVPRGDPVRRLRRWRRQEEGRRGESREEEVAAEEKRWGRLLAVPPPQQAPMGDHPGLDPGDLRPG